jgi:cell division protein FtsQ
LPVRLRGEWRALRAHRRVRIALLCGVLALPLLGGGWLWLRHSSFVAVEHVRISGVHGPQAQEIEAALRQAAHGMSTLAVSTRTLRQAVERFPMVSMVSARASFPHSLRIAVEEEPPVAVLTAAGVKTAVAADGTVLGDSLASGSLPSIADDVAPGAGQHVSNALILAALRLLGGAPPALDRLTSKVYEGPRGLTAVMSNGLVVYFGDDTLARAKWLSLARVLADSSSAGATYVDVELPDRPAAGFSSGEQAPGSEAGTPTKATRESTVSALAAGLAANSSDPSQSSTNTSGESSAATSTEAGEATKAEGEAPATATPEGAEPGH